MITTQRLSQSCRPRLLETVVRRVKVPGTLVTVRGPKSRVSLLKLMIWRVMFSAILKKAVIVLVLFMILLLFLRLLLIRRADLRVRRRWTFRWPIRKLWWGWKINLVPLPRLLPVRTEESKFFGPGPSQ